MGELLLPFLAGFVIFAVGCLMLKPDMPIVKAVAIVPLIFGTVLMLGTFSTPSAVVFYVVAAVVLIWAARLLFAGSMIGVIFGAVFGIGSALYLYSGLISLPYVVEAIDSTQFYLAGFYDSFIDWLAVGG